MIQKKSRAAYKKIWRERRKQAGLCLDCKDFAAPGSIYCQACLLKRRAIYRDYMRERRKALRESKARCE